jgi:hypothetical protein
MAQINPIQVEKFLKGLDYPASKQDVVQCAKKNGADDNVNSALQQLPDRTFEGPSGISKALGEINHQ